MRSFKSSPLLILTACLVMLFTVQGIAFADEWPDLTGEKLTVMGVWTGSSQENFESVLDVFEEKTGATVVYNPPGENLATVLGAQIEGGSPPDLAMLPQPGLLIELARDGSLVPIESIVGELVDEQYAPVWRQLGTVDGVLFGVWFKAANKSVFWYNANIFRDAGLEVPKTWEELMQAADILYAFGYTPFSLGGASSWTLTDWFENIYLRSAGPEMYDKLTKHEIPWTHESVREAFTYLKQVFGRPEWLAGGVQGSLEANHPQGIIRPFLEPPQAVMAYGADFSAAAIMNETKALLGKEALFFDFPSIGGSPRAVVGGGDVAVLLKDTPGGRALIKFLATAEAAEIWAAKGGFTSPNKAVDLSVYPNEIVRKSAEALQRAEWFRFDLSDLVPSAFGSTAGQGLRGLLQEFIRTPDVNMITAELEEDAREAYTE